ncbi:hypothetical protein DID88_008017 [Monilinia fructigena]|uniref:LITAF domain-containing protein n=1 Tax=Monilinia fructigena TaxID=38457 RepID=A0A395J4H7_9HELO|nr:hypothetical protein DID88_008017 [Monilinia fructigena]
MREKEKVACDPNAIDENRKMERRSRGLDESEGRGQSQSQYLVPLSVLHEESRLVGCPECSVVGFTVVSGKRSGSTEIPITVDIAASAEIATAGGTVQKKREDDDLGSTRLRMFWAIHLPICLYRPSTSTITGTRESNHNILRINKTTYTKPRLQPSHRI